MLVISVDVGTNLWVRVTKTDVITTNIAVLVKYKTLNLHTINAKIIIKSIAGLKR